MAAEPAPGVRWTTAVLDVEPAEVAAAAAFWCDVTGSSVSARRGDRGEFATRVPPDGDACLRMQDLVAGPGRCHLDLHVDDVAVAAEQAIALGADVRADRRGPIVVLAWPGGHHGLVDQICLDVPAPVFEAEDLFWASLSGWELHRGSRPEFSVLGRPVGLPLRLMLQRLDESAPGQPVAAHVDLACDDVGAEVARHLVLGARVVRRTEFWVTLADPAGRHYCVTRRDPDTGSLEH